MTPTQEELFAQHLQWSRMMADRTTKRLPRHFDREAARQEAAIGLFEAVLRFDPNHGELFTTFAVNRIRGRVLDLVRDLDHHSRTERRDIKAGLLVESKQVALASHFAAEDSRDREIVEARDLFASLCRRVRPRIREVLIHRAHGLTMKQIGLRMGLSESRISQLNDEAVRDARYEFAELQESGEMTLQEVEKEHILRALARHNGDKKAVAVELGISLKTVYTKLNLYKTATNEAEGEAVSA